MSVTLSVLRATRGKQLKRVAQQGHWVLCSLCNEPVSLRREKRYSSCGATRSLLLCVIIVVLGHKSCQHKSSPLTEPSRSHVALQPLRWSPSYPSSHLRQYSLSCYEKGYQCFALARHRPNHPRHPLGGQNSSYVCS